MVNVFSVNKLPGIKVWKLFETKKYSGTKNTKIINIKAGKINQK